MPATVHKPGAVTKARRREKAAAHARPARTAAARKKAAAKNLIEEFKVSESQDTRGKRVAEGRMRDAIAYRSTKGVDDYVRRVARATPMEIVEIERQGVLGSFIKDLSKRMEIPSSRFFTILGVPRRRRRRRPRRARGSRGRGGQATIGMVKLLEHRPGDRRKQYRE